MSQQLTVIMSRAVSEVRITSSWLVDDPGYARVFIFVEPNHSDYWLWFKGKYPHWAQVALKHKVKYVDSVCPEFPTKKNLLDWLSDVLNLSHGERNLLQLCVGFESCHNS
ncbi:hypothetical protein DRO59_06115 [Candidatus Bathyarchaeota archaeon]|nr:MAG: hypothetical protein DRO59_06115 [Candidatus Bathyarchaeota archaeon]